MMAKDPQAKKRKASVPEVDAEKTKTKKIKNASTDALEAPVKKRKATEDATLVKVKKSKTPKPVAGKPVESETAVDIEAATAAEKLNGTKMSAKSKKRASKDTAIEDKPKSKAVAKGSKVAKAGAVKSNEKPQLTADPEIEDGEEEDSELDDQTEALLKGFESDGDDEDALNEEGLPAGAAVPERKQLTKADEKKLKKIAESQASNKPGVVYVGRIPHGFFEHEMRAYFTQFGNILKLRLSRNKKTGASKHCAWIQFESTEVADIVAKTMDNYLMFGHLLKVKLVPDEQVHEDLFKGANKRFKKIPWNKLEGRKLEQGKDEEEWDARVEKEEKRRNEKAKKLKAMGYEFDSPKVKSAKGVSKKQVPIIETAADETESVPAIEAALVSEEPSKSKKKSKKAAKAEVETKEIVEEDEVAEPAKKTKSKKTKAIEATAPVEEKALAVATEASEPKAKKGKKEKKRKSDWVDVPVEEPVSEAVETKTKTKKTKSEKSAF
ncbi:RNA-binding domain-containing protein [Acephala macrosclerotiorum]|nr:RNA-binding domain-containing protein [Acephala macrosclerotiorum]